MGWGHLLEIQKGSGKPSPHTPGPIGFLIPDPGDRIRSDLVPHFLSQVLGFLDGIQSLKGKHRPGLQAELSNRGLGSQERKGPRGAGLGRAASLAGCPAYERSKSRLEPSHRAVWSSYLLPQFTQIQNGKNIPVLLSVVKS